MSDEKPVVFDDDNPEWTEADFARARPISDHPELAAAFPNGAKPVGRPKGSTTSQKQQVALRLDRETVEKFKADGPGWQTRMNETLRTAAGLGTRDHALLIGGRSNGEVLHTPVFLVTINYSDGSREDYRHIDLGRSFPFVLRAASDKRTPDEIRAALKTPARGGT